MRKAFRYLLPILLILLLIPTFLFACKTEEVPSFTLHISGANISWDAVDGAAYYKILCTTPDGGSYSARSDICSFIASQTKLGDYLYTAVAYDKKGTIIARSEDALYHIGKGGHTDPILISSVEEMTSITSGSVAVAFGQKSVYAPLYYKLISDLDFTGKKVTPIGTKDTPFRGYFDGNGHTISNLSFTQSNSVGRIGLFGTMTNAVIKNLTLKNASIVMDHDSGVSGNGLEYGLLVAYSKESVIDNCHVTGNIDFMKDTDTTGTLTADIGGIVGYLTGGKVFASSFTGTINARYSQVFTGGIAGYAQSGTQALRVTNCLSDATVNGYATGYDLVNKESTAKARVGVLFGSLSGDTIAMNVAVGSATAQAAGKAATGTDASSITCGAIGYTPGSSEVNSVPIIDLFYSADTISAVSGTRSNLGSGNTAYGLTAEELKDLSKYIIGDSSALDFTNIWEMGDEHPVLRGKGQTLTHDDVTLVVHSETEDVTYTFSMNDTFLPLYYSLTFGGETHHYTGRHLNDLLTTTLGLSLAGSKEVVISSEGTEDLHLAVKTSGSSYTFPSTYLFYGTYNNAYSRMPEPYDGVHIINGTTPNSPYVFTGDTITITIVKADETPAE